MRLVVHASVRVVNIIIMINILDWGAASLQDDLGRNIRLLLPGFGRELPAHPKAASAGGQSQGTLLLASVGCHAQDRPAHPEEYVIHLRKRERDG